MYDVIFNVGCVFFIIRYSSLLLRDNIKQTATLDRSSHDSTVIESIPLIDSNRTFPGSLCRLGESINGYFLCLVSIQSIQSVNISIYTIDLAVICIHIYCVPPQ